jgi:hypothetical protein
LRCLALAPTETTEPMESSTVFGQSGPGPATLVLSRIQSTTPSVSDGRFTYACREAKKNKTTLIAALPTEGDRTRTPVASRNGTTCPVG